MIKKKSSPGATGEGKERCEVIASYIVETGCTVREAAGVFCISKSTVHKDVTEKLCRENPDLFDEVREVLIKNKSERHIRGGYATKRKYMKIKKHAKNA